MWWGGTQGGAKLPVFEMGIAAPGENAFLVGVGFDGPGVGSSLRRRLRELVDAGGGGGGVAGVSFRIRLSDIFLSGY